MIDYRIEVDELLTEWCCDNNIEYSDMHDEAFVVKVDGVWNYIWYNEDYSVHDHLRKLKDTLNVL